MKAGEVINPINLTSIEYSSGLVKIQLVEKPTGKIIDEAIIKKVEDINKHTVIEVESFKLYPQENSRFIFIGDSWSLITKDPMSGTWVFGKNSPDYELRIY